MDFRYTNHPEDTKHYTTAELRQHFLQENIFAPDDILLTYTHVDRMIFGGAMPQNKALRLEAGQELRAAFFLQRREMGIINIGGAGTVTADGEVYPLLSQDGMYIGMGTQEVVFASDDPCHPAKFYLCSSPAHTTYPTVKLAPKSPRHLGDPSAMNKRTIYQYVHPAVCQSCQLTMGLTKLAEGNSWNTMPCHLHERRMEVYFYFDMPDDAVVFHLMGQPQETRHIVMRNEQAVISPSWSIHAGVGTAAYTFIWGMCGENQDFDDMDGVAAVDLR